MLDYFLKLLLPRTGPYCIFFIKKDPTHKGGHRWFDTQEDMAEFISSSPADKNIYFALANFTERKRRTETVQAYKTLYLDIDCGVNKAGVMRDYETQADGLQALATFCKKLRLPRPLLVDSGWGIHAYWPLAEEIDLAQWKSYQNILKYLAVKLGLKIDVHAINKATQVSRPIHTYNVRDTEHRLVRILGEYVPPYDIRLLTLLQERASEYNYKPEHVSTSRALMRVEKDVFALHQDFPPAKAEVIENECGQVEYAIRHPNDISYDHWFRIVGLAKFCEHPEETAKHWSHGYATYDPDETIAKLDSWNSGPPLCATLQSSGPKNICEVCPHNTHVKTPVQIAFNVETVEDESGVTLHNYRRTRKDGIVKVLPDDSLEFVSPYDVTITEIFWDDVQSIEHVTLEWHGLNARDTTVRQAVLPWYTLAPGYNGLVETFNKLGITTVRGKVEALELARYLSEFKREMERLRMRPTFYDSLGWKQEHTQFVLGESLFRLQDGEVVTDKVSHNKNMHNDILEGVKPRGSLEEWRKLSKYFNHPDLRAHAFVFLCGFGAPLLELTGYNGVMLNMVGKSGTGKTTVGSTVLSIMGNPRLLQIKANATLYSIYRYFASINNLSGYLDEVTNMRPEILSELCYNLSSGEERKRLNPDGTPKPSKRWSTIAISSSNNSIADKLLLYRTSPEAELLRLFEIQVPSSPAFTSGGYGVEINKIIKDNYGVAGPEFCKFILKNKDRICEVISKAEQWFKVKYNFTFLGQERFWLQLFMCADLGGRIAKQLGLLDIDVKACIEHALIQLSLHRANVDTSMTSAVDVITQYTLEFYNNINVVQLNPAGTVYTSIREARGQLHGLIEIHADNTKYLFIDSKTFHRWCTERGEVIKEIKLNLKRMGVTLKDSVHKKLDPAKSGVATPCLQLDLNHPVFHETQEIVAKDEAKTHV